MIAQKTTKLIGVPHEYEAELIASALRDRGIESQVVGGVMADFRAECPGLVDVLVSEDDAPAAVEVLHDLNTAPQKIDWDNVDVGESEYADDSHVAEVSLPSRSFVLVTMILIGILYVVAATGANLFNLW